MGKRKIVALLGLSSWCLVRMVKRLFLAVPQGCLRFVIVVFPDHTHYFCVWSTFCGVVLGVFSNLAISIRKRKPSALL